MRELTADTIIRVRRPRPEPRKRELTGDTRIRLSQIVDLKDWALEMAQDEAAPEGAVHHWSDGDHVKKNGKWVPVINNKKEVTRTLSAESRSTPTQASNEAPNVKTATKTQERKLKRFSCTVDVSKIDTKAVKIIDKTISSMIRDYKMRPLDHINMDSKNPQKWAYSDGEGITLNETFFNNPGKHNQEMQEKMDYKSYGGAMLLGVNKVVVKGHGSSDARSFYHAIRVTYELIKKDMINKMKEELR